MANQKENAKFFGVKRETLTGMGLILAPTLTVLLAVIALNGTTNASINRLSDALAETNAAIADLAAQSAAQNGRPGRGDCGAALRRSFAQRRRRCAKRRSRRAKRRGRRVEARDSPDQGQARQHRVATGQTGARTGGAGAANGQSGAANGQSGARTDGSERAR